MDNYISLKKNSYNYHIHNDIETTEVAYEYLGNDCEPEIIINLFKDYYKKDKVKIKNNGKHYVLKFDGELQNGNFTIYHNFHLKNI